MLYFVDNYFAHTDDRGSIRGLINQGIWKELNLITSEAGVVRGNHYHKRTQELFIILEGVIEVHTQRVNHEDLAGEISVYSVRAGDVFWIDPLTNHTFIPKTYSKWINVLSEPIDRDNPDFYRITLSHARK